MRLFYLTFIKVTFCCPIIKMYYYYYYYHLWQNKRIFLLSNWLRMVCSMFQAQVLFYSDSELSVNGFHECFRTGNDKNLILLCIPEYWTEKMLGAAIVLSMYFNCFNCIIPLIFLA